MCEFVFECDDKSVENANIQKTLFHIYLFHIYREFIQIVIKLNSVYQNCSSWEMFIDLLMSAFPLLIKRKFQFSIILKELLIKYLLKRMFRTDRELL